MTQKIISANDVISIYITFEDSNLGKKRSVLVLEADQNTFSILRLTSQYENKSPRIKQQYYPIKDWRQIGLRKPSYVDIGSVIQIDRKTQKRFYKIGSLTTNDIEGLNHFITDYLEKKHQGKH